MTHTYSGWTNRATWLVNLHWGDTIASTFQEPDRDTLADLIKDYVWAEIGNELPRNSISRNFVGLVKVNWRELAEHYIADQEL